MPRHREKRTVPYSAEQMFDLVADVERYPEFLPWVTAARKLRDDPNAVAYELSVGFKMVRERFTSKVTVDRPTSISVRYLRGPMRHLTNDWQFKDLPGGGCQIDFELDFEFRSRMLQKLIGALFHEAVLRVVESFERRARTIYGTVKTAAPTTDNVAVNLSPPKPVQ